MSRTEPLFYLLLVIATVGHSAFWVALLNHVYARPIPKPFLKSWRMITWASIAVFPVAYWFFRDELIAYEFFCWVMFLIFVLTTIERNFRRQPQCILEETTTTFDPWPTHRHTLIGHGEWHWLPRLPFNRVLKFDITRMTLAVPKLPKDWEDLTVLLMSDLHFHGTPSQLWFQQIFDEIEKLGTPDLVVLAGDFLDNEEQFVWLEPLLGRLKWKEKGIAILGNHDVKFSPEAIRTELTRLGFTVLSNAWQSTTLRGVPAVIIGSEEPWFRPGPDLSSAPAEPFRICVSHTPDYFGWAAARGVGLMFCGHVHGGQVRFPIIGSVFVPSWYSRRYDMGVFEKGDTVMVVSRGLSGKEPLRFRCNAQAMWITLKPLAASRI